MKKLITFIMILVPILMKAQVYTVTVYNAVREQCNGNHLQTADGSIIDTQKLERGELQWCAVSRDMLQEGWKYGDKIEILSPDPLISGIYEIHDTMSKKHHKRIDILMPKRINKGRWSVRVRKPKTP